MEQYTIKAFIVGFTYSPEPRLLYLGDPEKTLPTMFSFFLVENKERKILIDVGFTVEYGKKYMPDVLQNHNQDPLKQLKKHGIEAGDINEIIITHAHFDHLSDVVEKYTNARIYIQRTELDFVLNPPHPWFQELVDIYLIKELVKEGAPRFNLIDGECELFPGIFTIPTPGHTQGHQSVLVETEKGKACITGDAILSYRNLTEDIGPGFNCNLIDSLSSIGKLRNLSEKDISILSGHDPKMFENYSELLLSI